MSFSHVVTWYLLWHLFMLYSWNFVLITCPDRDFGFLYWAFDAYRCKRLLVNVEDTFMDEAVYFHLSSYLSYMIIFLQTGIFDLAIPHKLYLSWNAALDSDDLLYLKEQMEAEEDAERLLRRTEKRAFAAFKISFTRTTLNFLFWFFF